jgi:ABC-type transport system substrate-binding protein
MVALLAAAVMVVGGLGAPLVANAQGGPPGVLQIAILSDVTLNPFTLPQQLPTLLVSKTLFSTLTRYQPGDLKPVGDLATSWRALEGGKVWEFKLK